MILKPMDETTLKKSGVEGDVKQYGQCMLKNLNEIKTGLKCD